MSQNQVQTDVTETTMVVPTIELDVSEYTVSQQLWVTLQAEINSVATRIESGAELTPDDFVRVKQLKSQVDEYVKTFNKAVRDKHSQYKQLVEKQLLSLGYDKIDRYVNEQRKIQTDSQNQRMAAKLSQLKDIIDAVVATTTHVQNTAIAGELVSIFCARFPNIKSGAKSKDITNWEPYEQVIKTNLAMVDTFFADPVFAGATKLPVQSYTIQQLMKYLRSGDIEDLRSMRNIFNNDSATLQQMALKEVLVSKEVAVDLIRSILSNEASSDDYIKQIASIIDIVRYK